jgi:hypothetical protein
MERDPTLLDLLRCHGRRGFRVESLKEWQARVSLVARPKWLIDTEQDFSSGQPSVPK